MFFAYVNTGSSENQCYVGKMIMFVYIIYFMIVFPKTKLIHNYPCHWLQKRTKE